MRTELEDNNGGDRPSPSGATLKREYLLDSPCLMNFFTSEGLVKLQDIFILPNKQQ